MGDLYRSGEQGGNILKIFHRLCLKEAHDIFTYIKVTNLAVYLYLTSKETGKLILIISSERKQILVSNQLSLLETLTILLGKNLLQSPIFLSLNTAASFYFSTLP